MKVPAFSVPEYFRVTPLSLGNGNNYKGSRPLVRSSVITFGTKAPAFSVNIYASRRCHGATVLITTGIAAHSFAFR
jgi:hypothetical protein